MDIAIDLLENSRPSELVSTINERHTVRRIGNRCGCALPRKAGMSITEPWKASHHFLPPAVVHNPLASHFPCLSFCSSIYAHFYIWRYPLLFLCLNNFSYSPTMFKSTLAIFALMASSIAAPAPEFIVERHIVEVYKRQADISQLLEL